jgi:hypothetical protein
MINYGEIVSIQGIKFYVKHVKFSAAVLWKDKQISLRKEVLGNAFNAGVQVLRFVDNKKGEIWDFNIKDAINKGIEKQEGQEPQIYFPIDLAVKKKL